MRTGSKIFAPLVVALLLLVGCGSDDTADDTPSTTAANGSASPGFPITVEAANGEITIPERPERIVILAPSLTETVFAIGAGDQVVAVDDQSNFPEGVPVTDLSGYMPNVEAIADYEPDLVLSSERPDDLVGGLERLDIPLLVLPAAVDVDDAYAQIELIGDATGHGDAAREVVTEMQTRMDELASRVPEGAPATYFHELDDQLYTVTSKTFIGGLYEMAGFENIADAADPDGTGYPQISAEALIEADPDVVFLADVNCCAQSAETVSSRPGWSEMAAVRNGRIVLLDDDVASRWGPRLVDFFEAIVDARVAQAT